MTQNPSQKFFVNVLIDLLRNNSLQDFNLDGTFRRANAMFLGCALTVRNTITENNVYADIYHFVCVFCTKDSEMRTAYSTKENDSDCPPTSFRGAEKLLPELCAVKGRHSFLMCVPYNICHWEKTNRPVYWQTRDPGTVIELTMVETNTGPVLLVKEEHIGSYNKEGKPSYYNMTHYLDRNGSYLKDLMFYPQLPKYVYDHSPKHLQKLSDTLSNLTKGALTAISPVISEPAVVYIPNEAIEGTEDAWCCTYVLILSCFPTCVLAVLICYTIKNF
ncbi:uncharacterized protein LOC135849774 [Planococcus citri]|uniref:uncharacterized protein LOC135849774 n=1 Tax=Planococcus citri TaxID=170843 RepID=UPI0031F8CC42